MTIKCFLAQDLYAHILRNIMDCGDIREILGLDRCVSCGVCTDACPSARHGGIVPDAAVASVTVGETPERIWDCLMCHRCSMACPQKIDVAEMMALLRGISDGTPERYLRSAVQVYRTGRTVSASKRTASQREVWVFLPRTMRMPTLCAVLDREGCPMVTFCTEGAPYNQVASYRGGGEAILEG